MSDKELRIGDCVKLKTNCIWNGCGGTIHSISEYIGVTMPDNETKMAFRVWEVEKCR